MTSKPSFLSAFLPACVVLLGIECLKTKFQSFKNSFCLGCCFVPTMFILYLQNAIIYTEDAPSSIIFSLGMVWAYYSSNFLISSIISIAFPLFIYVISPNKDFFAHLCSSAFLLSFLIYYFLAESGERFTHGNFGWGLSFGCMLLFLGAVHLCFRNKYSKLNQLVAGILFSTHVFSGILFIQYMFYFCDYK